MPLEEAYEKYGKEIATYCGYKLYCPEKGKDAAQDVFLRYHEYKQRHPEVEILNVKNFLYRSATNYCHDLRRKWKNEAISLDSFRDEEDVLTWEPPAPDRIHESDARIDLSLIRPILHTLPERHRDILLMRYHEGYTPQDIADHLGTDKSTAGVALYRARKKLLERIQIHYLNKSYGKIC